MAPLGSYLLLAAFVICAYAATISVAGARRRSRRLISMRLKRFHLLRQTTDEWMGPFFCSGEDAGQRSKESSRVAGRDDKIHCAKAAGLQHDVCVSFRREHRDPSVRVNLTHAAHWHCFLSPAN